MIATVRKVEQWGKYKGLTGEGNYIHQFIKVQEEVGELSKEIIQMKQAEENNDFGWEYNYKLNAQMELGDCLVTLILLANCIGTDAEKCLNMAYEKIKNRKGKTINGTFVKEEDLRDE